MDKAMNSSGRFIVLAALCMLIASTGLAAAAAPAGPAQVIKITAKKFEYSPNEIRIKTGVPVVFEFTSLDRVHGFTVPGLNNVRLTIEPGKANRVTILAPKASVYEFHCDLFCGDGHEDMTGRIIVED
jgi:cytochrome c oxidase subunit 2